VFLTQKEPVYKSHLFMKPTALGALPARATIVRCLGKHLFSFFAISLYFPLRCHRRGRKVAHETLLTFIFYSVIILWWQVWSFS